MEPKSRYDRDLDIHEPTQATSRFERFDRGLKHAALMIHEGAELKATLAGDRVHVRIGEWEGIFPAFEIGVENIGEAAKYDTKVETFPGACAGESAIDRLILEGGTVMVTDLGGRLHATLCRKLPERTFVDRKKEHRVYRKGIRKAVGETLLGVVEAALEAEEEVLEGSLMSVT